MNILETIITDKFREVAERKSLIPVKLLEKSTFFDGKVVSMKKYVTDPEKIRNNCRVQAKITFERSD